MSEKKDNPELRDVLKGERITRKIHNHGMISLVDMMPRLVPKQQTADSAIVQAARVSYGEGTKKRSEDRSLIRYLMRNRHSTPFEMVEFKFHVAMPIFVARQWVRHRTASINEYSGRYSIMKPNFYRPGEVRGQDAQNKQGSGELVDDYLTIAEFGAYLNDAEELHGRYKGLVESGVSRELARIGLPLNMYTEWYWKCDLHNIMHFLSLRMDSHAQKEIRDYADAMFDILCSVVPITMEAFVDYRLKGMHLSRLEVEALASGEEIKTSNKRERDEFSEKLRRIRGES